MSELGEAKGRLMLHLVHKYHKYLSCPTSFQLTGSMHHLIYLHLLILLLVKLHYHREALFSIMTTLEGNTQ